MMSQKHDHLFFLNTYLRVTEDLGWGLSLDIHVLGQVAAMK